jgi:hypothetical protein
VDVLKNQLNRILEVVNGGLSALTPAVGTARELTDSEREAAKFGLNLCKLTLQSLNTLCVCHNVGGVVRPNGLS